MHLWEILKIPNHELDLFMNSNTNTKSGFLMTTYHSNDNNKIIPMRFWGKWNCNAIISASILKNSTIKSSTDKIWSYHQLKHPDLSFLTYIAHRPFNKTTIQTTACTTWPLPTQQCHTNLDHVLHGYCNWHFTILPSPGFFYKIWQ